MHQRHAARLAGEFQRPVERGIAAAENHKTLAGELGRALHLVVNARAFERFDAFDAQTTRLKRAEAAGNDHGARMEARVQRGAQQERVILQHLQLGRLPRPGETAR